MTIEEIRKAVKTKEYDFLKSNPHLGNNIILLGLGGSHAYGTNNECSDLDISGGAYGADSLGEKFAKQYNIPVKQFLANWNVYGKRAGYLRNKEMAEYAAQNLYGVLIAFWDMKSKVTRHMINLATEYKLKVFIVNINNGEIIECMRN